MLRAGEDGAVGEGKEAGGEGRTKIARGESGRPKRSTGRGSADEAPASAKGPKLSAMKPSELKMLNKSKQFRLLIKLSK